MKKFSEVGRSWLLNMEGAANKIMLMSPLNKLVSIYQLRMRKSMIFFSRMRRW